ncbi:potassium channel subfamily K member 5-like [Lampris incognitus]|uniref:potassium channel subfamily K member 5-like n=1 Tax=Lampris incognitus TaxID=2546036 RepID=UPI0024B5C321|nr:potassium channel subfamily K member 5-like [Lampris incognitus]
MADKGPFLTSCIIFYLSIGAAIFQILEEPNWEAAKSTYTQEKHRILQKYTCLTEDDLEDILEVVSEAAGQGVTITGKNHIKTWDWSNSVIFAATIVTTIGYGNVAPKTINGRVFCIMYGLCGIPLCLVWISELGSFFGDRAKRLSQILIRKGIAVKKVQFICTALFLLWGLFVHLVIPPIIFMSLEGWSYLEGLYFSFITLTTVGFGDYVAGVNPNIEYPSLYRVFAELWIYMGLAWLSLFFSWNVHMVVEAHKVLKKRRHKPKLHLEKQPQPAEEMHSPEARPTVIDIFKFLSENEDDYSTVIKGIGESAKKRSLSDSANRSKSCSDILATNIQTLDHSPRRRRKFSISEMFIDAKAAPDCNVKAEEGLSLILDSDKDRKLRECLLLCEEDQDSCVFDSEKEYSISCEPDEDLKEEEGVQGPGSGGTRFTISKVSEGDLITDKDEEG